MSKLRQQMDDFTEAFGIECAWSMAGVILIYSPKRHDGDFEQIRFKPDGAIWAALAVAAAEIIDIRAAQEQGV